MCVFVKNFLEACGGIPKQVACISHVATRTPGHVPHVCSESAERARLGRLRRRPGRALCWGTLLFKGLSFALLLLVGLDERRASI